MKTTTTAAAAAAAAAGSGGTKKKKKTKVTSSLFRSMQRKVEYLLGKQILSYANDISLKQCQLQYKTIYLPKSKLIMHYYERDFDFDSAASGNNNKKNKNTKKTTKTTTASAPSPPPTTTSTTCATTLVFLHGLADEGKNFGPFISSLLKSNKNNSNVRIIVPDLIGHGNDLKRYKQKHDQSDIKNNHKDKNNSQEEGEGDEDKDEGEVLQLPTPNLILQVTIEFLELVLSSSSSSSASSTTTTTRRCHGFGYSIGGALLYYIKYKRPDLIDRTCLIAPSLQYVINDAFVNDFVTNRKNHFCFESRHDAKVLFRDLSIPDDDDDDDNNNNDDGSKGQSRRNDRSRRRRRRKKDNPIPKFFLQSIYKLQVQSTPPNHFRNILSVLLESRKRAKFDGIIPSHDNDTHRSGKDDGGKGSSANNNYDDEDKLFHNTHDIDPTSHRLVIWPEYDYICNHDKGKQFFLGVSSSSSSSSTPRGDGNDAMITTSEHQKVPAMESTVTNSSNATPGVGVDPTTRKSSETMSPAGDGAKSSFNAGKVNNTEFITVRDAGHLFHSDGTFILDLEHIHSRIRSFLLD